MSKHHTSAALHETNHETICETITEKIREATSILPATSDIPLLQITQLNFAYRLANGKHINALRNLNLQLQKGTILGLIGESGCGKTTLCNILMHSLSYHQGHIYLHGQELSSMRPTKPQSHRLFNLCNLYSSLNLPWHHKHHPQSSLQQQLQQPQQLKLQQQPTQPQMQPTSYAPHAAVTTNTAIATSANTAANATAAATTTTCVACSPTNTTVQPTINYHQNYYRHVQYVFQDPLSAMPPHLTLHHFACAPLINLCHYSTKQARVALEQLIERVQLPINTLQRYPQELSLGQLQRLNLIKSLSIKPDLLLCDEITTALDHQTAKLCLHLLQEYQEAGGTTIFITHDLNLAPQICNQFALMFKGTIVEQWTQNEQPFHPYMQQLQQAQAIMAQEIDLSSWQDPQALSCPVSVDELCPFLLRCPKNQERCLQQAPQLHQLNTNHQICCHLVPFAHASPPKKERAINL